MPMLDHCLVSDGLRPTNPAHSYQCKDMSSYEAQTATDLKISVTGEVEIIQSISALHLVESNF